MKDRTTQMIYKKAIQSQRLKIPFLRIAKYSKVTEQLTNMQTNGGTHPNTITRAGKSIPETVLPPKSARKMVKEIMNDELYPIEKRLDDNYRMIAQVQIIVKKSEAEIASGNLVDRISHHVSRLFGFSTTGNLKAIVDKAYAALNPQQKAEVDELKNNPEVTETKKGITTPKDNGEGVFLTEDIETQTVINEAGQKQMGTVEDQLKELSTLANRTANLQNIGLSEHPQYIVAHPFKDFGYFTGYFLNHSPSKGLFVKGDTFFDGIYSEGVKPEFKPITPEIYGKVLRIIEEHKNKAPPVPTKSTNPLSADIITTKETEVKTAKGTEIEGMVYKGIKKNADDKIIDGYVSRELNGKSELGAMNNGKFQPSNNVREVGGKFYTKQGFRA